MGHVSPFTPWISKEWEALSMFAETPLEPDEKYRRARALFGSCVTDGEWKVAVADAGLATYPVTVCALQSGDFRKAAEYCLQYLKHPDARSSPHGSADEFLCYLAVASIALGEIDVGVRAYLEVIAEGVYPAQSRRHLVRNSLLTLVETGIIVETVDERILGLVQHLMSGWKGQRRKAKLAVEIRTSEGLGEFLMSTYPVVRPECTENSSV